MRLPLQSTSSIDVTATETRRIPRGQILGPAGLAAIVLLAAVRRFANLAIATAYWQWPLSPGRLPSI